MKSIRALGLLTTLATVAIAVPSTAQADIIQDFENYYEGSSNPIPGNRGQFDVTDTGDPCGVPQTSNQATYTGMSYLIADWSQFGSPPTLTPPGTFWTLNGQTGFVPTDTTNTAAAIPAGNMAIPTGAQTVTTTSWTVSPAEVDTVAVPYQPESSVVCSEQYSTSYSGPYSPFGSQGAVATADCSDGYAATPFVQWYQNLGVDTPAIFNGVSDSAAAVSALEAAAGGAAGSTAGTVVWNTLKQLWGGAPTAILGGAVTSALEDAVSGYLSSAAQQDSIMANATWDYYADIGVSWMTWSPSSSSMTSGRLAVNLVTPNAATDYAAISVVCSSAPTVQGSVLNMQILNTPPPQETQLGLAYYGSPSQSGTNGSALHLLRATGARKTPKATEDTVIGTHRRSVRVATGAGNDHVNGSPGADVVRAGAGNDKIDGGARGSDRLSGGPGSDLILDWAGAGDRVSGGSGIDRIDVRDRSRGADRVRCGSGEDIVLADRGDVVAADCEHVFRRLADAPHDLDDALKQPRNWPRPQAS